MPDREGPQDPSRRDFLRKAAGYAVFLIGGGTLTAIGGVTYEAVAVERGDDNLEEDAGKIVKKPTGVEEARSNVESYDEDAHALIEQGRESDLGQLAIDRNVSNSLQTIDQSQRYQDVYDKLYRERVTNAGTIGLVVVGVGATGVVGGLGLLMIEDIRIRRNRKRNLNPEAT